MSEKGKKDSESGKLISRKDGCVWKLKGICKIPDDKLCPDDCDLKDLEFDKNKIIERMKFEEKEVQRLKKESMWKNRDVIKDRIMGMYVLQKCLKKHFDFIRNRT